MRLVVNERSSNIFMLSRNFYCLKNDNRSRGKETDLWFPIFIYLTEFGKNLVKQLLF